jgi:hypothetical protein
MLRCSYARLQGFVSRPIAVRFSSGNVPVASLTLSRLIEVETAHQFEIEVWQRVIIIVGRPSLICLIKRQETCGYSTEDFTQRGSNQARGEMSEIARAEKHR